MAFSTPPHLVLAFCLSMACTTSLFGQLSANYGIVQNNFQRINPAAVNHFATAYAADNASNHLSAQYQLQQAAGGTAATLFSGRYEQINYDKNIHWGIGFESEQIHYHANNRLQLSYAYLIDKRPDRGRGKRAHFGLGIALTGAHEVTDLTQIRFDDDTDETLPVNSQLAAAVSFGGFYLKRSRAGSFYSGLSIIFSDGGLNNLASRHYYFLAGGMLHLSPEMFTLEYSAWCRYADRGNPLNNYLYTGPVLVEGSARIWASGLHTKQKKLSGFFAGAGFGSHKRVKVEAGIGLFSRPQRDNLQNALKLGLAYDFDMGQQLGFGSFLEFFASMPIKAFTRGKSRFPIGTSRPTGARPRPQ